MALALPRTRATSPLGWLRITFRITCMAALLAIGVPLYYLARLITRHNPVPRLFLGAIAWIAGVQIRSEGERVRRGAFLLANHVSWIDIPAISAVTGSAFVGHDGLAAMPLLKWLCAMNDTVFVARHDRTSVAEQVERVRTALSDTGALTIFPEGTTSDGTGLLVFKSSLISALEPLPAGIALPAPGGEEELGLMIGRIYSTPLDRSRPLWEAWVIEGLKHDRFGFVIKVHHSAVDGAAGAEIMTELFDLDPTGRDLSEVEQVPTEHVPTDVELLSYAAMSKAKVYSDAFGLIGRTARSVNNLVSGIRNPARRHGAIPLTAPRTPFNASITPDRSVAFARVPLDEVKAIKCALDVKVNDVVLALCAGTLRKYLEDTDALPDEPLVAVRVRRARERSEQHPQPLAQGCHGSSPFCRSTR